MYLERKIDARLEHWKKDKNRLPLIIEGSRQVGKTESVRRFAKKHYKSFIEINFVLDEKFKAIIDDGYQVDAIIKNISRMDMSMRFSPGETLIFFDELQEFPEIATSLKAFAQDGRFDVICSGSLLGIQYKRIESNSVGYKQNFRMYGLDFEEFLLAKGYNREAVDQMLVHLLEETPFSKLEYDLFYGIFIDFCLTGGMPAVVKRYISNGTFEGIAEMQEQLLRDYREDIRKYTEGLDSTRVLSVYEQVPLQLAKENKKFQYSKIRKGAKSKDYFGCIEWLRDAGVIHLCYCMNFPNLPIKGNYDVSRFKLYMNDTGLLIASLDEEVQENVRSNKALGAYKGGLYENMVAEAFVKQELPLVYFSKQNSTLEEDFFVRTADCLIPVEVKANNNRSKSLRTLIQGEQYEDIRFGIKLCNANVGYANDIYTIPYFCSFLLKRYLHEKFKS